MDTARWPRRGRMWWRLGGLAWLAIVLTLAPVLPVAADPLDHAGAATIAPTPHDDDAIDLRVKVPAGSDTNPTTPGTVTVRSTATRTSTIVVDVTSGTVTGIPTESRPGQSSAGPVVTPVATSTPGAGGSGGLAFTGAPLVALALLGVFALAGGVTALVIGRCRVTGRR